MCNLQLKLNGIAGIIPRVSLVALIMLWVWFLCPISTTSTNAKDSPNYNKPAWIPSNYVSLSLGSMPAMDITPTGEGGSVGVSQASLKVSTTSNTGYKLYVSTLDHTTAMTSTDTNQSAAIASTNTIATASNLAPNTWGYTITDAVSDSTTYSPMPTTSTVAYDTAQASGEHYLSFAAKIDTSLPAGQYSNTVAISAIANPAVITGMMELTYMQDMTSSICHDTVGYDQNYNRDSNGSYIITPGSEVTKQLIDSRDGKEYWVAKLADGNCWMTQNLAYDLVKGKVLTPSDTDVTSDWVVPTSTEREVPARGSDSSATGTRSWDFGEYLLAEPEEIADCTIASLAEAQNCTALVNVGTWRPIYTAQDVTADNEVKYMAVDRVNETYDAHYLTGNWYQWNTATAGSGGDMVSTGALQDASKLVDAQDSICPKGWQLPKGGSNVVTGQPFAREDSVYNLMLAYGYPETGKYIQNNVNHLGYTSLLTGAGQNILRASMYWALSGVTLYRTGTWHNLQSGQFWSATAYPERDPFDNSLQQRAFFTTVDIKSGAVIAPNYAYKVTGINVRCLAK